MKRISISVTVVSLLVFLIYSCETKDDSITNEINTSKSSEVEKNSSLSCTELLNMHEDYTGEKVLLNAISWGSSASLDGDEILMSIDDKKLEGLQQAHVLVHFSKDQEEQIKHVAENDSISLKAIVGEYQSGALRLIDASVIEN